MTHIFDEIVAHSVVLSSGNAGAILRAIQEEVGETATELNIREGFKNREPGPDGVVGEGIDMLVTVVDFLCTETDVTTEEFKERVRLKLAKWRKNREALI